MGDFMTLGRRSGVQMKPDVGKSMTVKCQVPGYGEIAIQHVPGDTVEEVIETFVEWLKGDEGDDDWRTITASIDGKTSQLTFRGSWVAAFKV